MTFNPYIYRKGNGKPKYIKTLAYYVQRRIEQGMYYLLVWWVWLVCDLWVIGFISPFPDLG